jgi:hypothetical protein
LGVASVAGGLGISRLAGKLGSPAPLVEPACSRVAIQDRKRLVRADDRVVAWIRTGQNGGGAIPIRLLLTVPRVLDDSYGLFLYDADGGYVGAYRRNHGFEFHGYRRGVMVVRSHDGTLWSALTGAAFQGPRAGERLERIPSLLTTWGQWLRLHPQSTAYELFDGHTYPAAEIRADLSGAVRDSMGRVDSRLDPLSNILGVEAGLATRAYPLDGSGDHVCFEDSVDGKPIVVLRYRPTETAAAYRPTLGGRHLSFYPDRDGPEPACYKDRETGTRWTLAGQAVEGALKGNQLDWLSSVQCRWYAWAAEYPGTTIYGAG